MLIFFFFNAVSISIGSTDLTQKCLQEVPMDGKWEASTHEHLLTTTLNLYVMVYQDVALLWWLLTQLKTSNLRKQRNNESEVLYHTEQ